ncbi:hypothetical protein RGU12_09550 [Fredinandcohnia sp. QZ13]|uniref:hypothetical protein n=1 Tax=Fredinandcohnia sp. QZ13 TaxID=3073144 RepID=UPI00285333AC|nr:hypothetical protein [Fredinandcohnia sp. QZ13]MDR4887789.1 hypothetical protein [Fredinandcohnia sp. QZ13]
MKANNKAKWIVGITGAAFSAIVIGQINDFNADTKNSTAMAVEINDSMSEREKELIQLDWSDFSIQVNDNQGVVERDRTTRRS